MRKLSLAFLLLCLGGVSAGACNNGDDACKMAADALPNKCLDDAGKVTTHLQPGTCDSSDSVQRCTARCVALVATCADLTSLAAGMQAVRVLEAQASCASPSITPPADCNPDAGAPDLHDAGHCSTTVDTTNSIGPLYSETDLAKKALGGPPPPPDGGIVVPDAAGLCPYCKDNKVSGDESGKDCGGSCNPCTAVGAACRINSDCLSGICMASKCANMPVAITVSNDFRRCLANCLLF